jgi:CheY-like chemotaxis protein
LGLMGSWCEGEARTGKPWPGAVRIYWHQWLPRCGQEFRRMLWGECSAWGLPITATEEERLLLAADQPTPKRQGLIAIHTRPYEMEDWLSAALRRCGCSTVWLRPPRPARVEGATAAIFDGSDCCGEELTELKHLAATLRPAPVIALLDFPRLEDYHRVLAAGAAALLSKPLNLDDLYWQLDRVLETAPV